MNAPVKKIIVAVTGATGAPIALTLLRLMREMEIEIHLVISKWARATISMEAGVTVDAMKTLADFVYDERNLAASISSGSFLTDGMIVVPCSMKTLASIRIGLCDNLISRAADVVIKERRKLVVVPRESPLSPIHLENMLHLSRIGVTIFPPMPAFYNQPKSIDQLIEHIAARVLDQLGIHHPCAVRWGADDDYQEEDV